MIYVDDTIASSELAGILVLVGLLWSVWSIGWLIRVEVHALAAPIVNRLGLRWAREGFGARVRARGLDAAGQGIELRFGRGHLPGTLMVWRREGRAWVPVEGEGI